jgi:hypothetical protein
VAAAFGRTLDWVRYACRENSVDFSHRQRRLCRQQAAQRVANGESVRSVAAAFGRTATWVRYACREHSIVVHTHKERRLRRKQAAYSVAAGETVNAVAEAFGKSEVWVRDACREHSVDVPLQPRKPYTRRVPYRPPSPRKKRILKALEDPKRKYQSIADQFGVSKQRVQQIETEARGRGLPIPRRWRSFAEIKQRKHEAAVRVSKGAPIGRVAADLGISEKAVIEACGQSFKANRSGRAVHR